MNARMIVVGVDGSEASLVATDWAAREAYRRNAALRVVLAYHWTRPGNQIIANGSAEEVARRNAEKLVAIATDRARATAPRLAVTGEAIRGEPAQTLIDAASRASLLVVGSRGHGGFTSLLLGSVSLRVATHAKCPVVVVRGRVDAHDGPVVVGVDGSAGHEHTLETAFEAAAARNVPLIAVRTYELPMVWGVYAVSPAFLDPAEVETQERTMLTEDLAAWRDKYPNVAVEMLVVKGSAAGILVGESQTAQLVVVGTRGHGGFSGLLLGSVGQQLLHHANSPVLVVRP